MSGSAFEVKDLKMKLRYVIAAWIVIFSAHAQSQSTIKILSPVWQSLQADERTSIQERYVVDLRDSSAYAMVIDNQGVDTSTPGTSGGAVLGSAVANAAYIDRAFSGSNNYSAKTQLAMGLLGAVVGSTLDKPAVQQYHFRYALKQHDGEILYRDSVQGDPFRHPAGMCLELSTLTPASQALCNQTVADVRKAYLAAPSLESPVATVAASPTQRVLQPVAASVSQEKIDCKLNNLAPISTTLEKCTAIGGLPL